MRDECKNEVASAIGRALSEDEYAAIDAAIIRHQTAIAKRDPAAYHAMPQHQRMFEAAEAARIELLADAAKKRERTALQIAATKKLANDIAGYAGDKMDAIARIVAFYSDTRERGISIESTARAIERENLGRMLDLLEGSDAKVFGFFENNEGIRTLMRGLFGEKTGVKEVDDMVRVWREEVAEPLRQRFNRAGGDIGRLEDWGMPHHHSQRLVAKAGRDAWIERVMPMLDRSRYTNEIDGSLMNDVQVRDFLAAAFESIATGGANKITPGQFNGGGMRANRGNESRAIHFKDADSFIAYQKEFGEKALYDVLVGHVQGIARDIALVETLGPNPDHQMRLMLDTIQKQEATANPERTGKIATQREKVERLYELAAGKTQPVANATIASAFDGVRSWMVASRLGSAAISSLADFGTVFVTAAANNIPAWRVFQNQLRMFGKDARHAAQRLGLGLNGAIAELNRFGQEINGHSLPSKLATGVLRASGLLALTEANKMAFGVSMMSTLGEVVQKTAKLGDLAADDYRLLLSKGVTEANWEAWRKARFEDLSQQWGKANSALLTADSIYRIPDSELIGLAGQYGVSPQKLKEDAATRLLGHVLEETDVAVIEPGVRERAWMHAGMQRGTMKGELVKSFFVFKSFPIAMLTRHWTRALDMPSMGATAAYIAPLTLYTTLLGAAALELNEMASGRDPRQAFNGGVPDGRFWLAAAMKGGALGIYGDFLFSDATQYGSGPLASLTGPVIGMAEDAFKLTQGNILQASRGNKTNFGAELVRFVKGNTPFANLWYTKAVTDHLIFHNIQEAANPGYLKRVQTRAKREFGQQFWWEPGRATPARMPEFGRVVGQN
jgi:hypothetical protein